MADNTTLNTGTGGDIISTDVLTTLNGGVIATGEKVQRIKVGFGTDATLRDVDSDNPLPVVQEDALVTLDMNTTNVPFGSTVAGTGIVNLASGYYKISPGGTTISSGAWLYNNRPVQTTAASTLTFSLVAGFVTSGITNNITWFGFDSGSFSGNATPCASAGNSAYVFHKDSTGAFFASVWDGTATTPTTASSAIGTAINGRTLFQIIVQGDHVRWLINGTQVFEYRRAFTDMGGLRPMNLVWASVNSAVTPASGTVDFRIHAFTLTGKTIACATVLPPGYGAGFNENALVVAISPTSSNVSLYDNLNTASSNIKPANVLPAFANDSALVVTARDAVSVQGATLITTSQAIAAGGTGQTSNLNVSKAGNATFVVKNTVAASAWAGAPVLVFEQSDDATSWAALQVVRADTGAVGSTWILGPGAANAELMFDAALEGVTYVRCRCTTGPTTNGLTIVIAAGSLPFSPIVTTIDRKDAGRLPFIWYSEAVAGAIAEALISMSSSTGPGVTPTAANTYSVPAGKTLRLTSITVTFVATTTTANTTKLRLRALASGSAIVTSPIMWSMPRLGLNTATFVANQTNTYSASFPDGFEFAAGNSIALTHIDAAANGTIDVMITGFLY